MARRKQPPVPTARIYRHFAVVTMLLTGAVAVFADGENRAAMAEEIAEREQKNALARASAEKFGPPRLVKKPATANVGSFGSDSGEFGSPMDHAEGDNSSGYVPEDFAPANAFVPAAYSRFGLSAEEWARLDEEQRAALLRQMNAEAEPADAPERAQQIDRLKAASAARSGLGASD